MAMILFLFVLSFFTHEDQSKAFAIVAMLILLAVSIQDVAIDALCLKEIKDLGSVGVIQTAWMSSGVIIGGLFLLKGTSPEFA